MARRLIDPSRRDLAEVLVYVYPAARAEVTSIERVRWTPRGGYELLEFSVPVGATSGALAVSPRPARAR